MMLHDIEGVYTNRYEEKDPRPSDRILSFAGSSLRMEIEGNAVTLPTFSQVEHQVCNPVFLFSIDGTAYFLDTGADSAEHQGIDAGQNGPAGNDDFPYRSLRDFRWIRPREERFAIQAGWQLSGWYRDNRFCGRCGARTEHDRIERMLRCPQCGNMIYPRISPGIIVGVVDGDRLLLTRYARRPKGSWSLVAGFTEIGEPLEDTVRREVAEETGLHVKNIAYFGNQPWFMSSSLLVGFFADVDGDRTIRVDNEELAEGAWMPWHDVPHESDDYSLTRSMMCAFWENHGRPERPIADGPAAATRLAVPESECR